MKFSFSRVKTFEDCPYKFSLKYVRKLEALPNFEADNPLVLGSALHRGIEEGESAGLKIYSDFFPIFTEKHFEEREKLEKKIKEIRGILPKRGFFELKLETSDFLGFLDYLLITEIPSTFDLFEFKYSKPKNLKYYLNSKQLHIYKYYFEELTRKKIRNMYIALISKTEDEPSFTLVEFSEKKVTEFFSVTNRIKEARNFPKKETNLCFFCEYRTFCKSNEKIDYDILENTKGETENV
jgi:CRISPR/Cas system-associated exonuclease Cas4 (RecB family)